MNSLNISSRYIKSMLKFAEYRACNMQVIFERIGYDKHALLAASHVSVIVYGELYHAIVEQLDDEWFGLIKGGKVRRGSLRFLLKTLVHCKNLQEAIETSNEFFELSHGYSIKQQLSIKGSKALLQLTPLEHLSQAQFSELMQDSPIDIVKSTLLALHGINSWLTGQPIELQALHFHFKKDQDYSANPDTAIDYEQALSGYEMASKHLQLPIIQQPHNIDDFIRRAPYFVFMQMQKESLSQQIKSILAHSLGEAFPTTDEIAQILHISPATLFRQLKAEGISYGQIKNLIREDMAKHYLNHSQLSNEQISERLGFDNPSTFYRAFKKWTGQSPKSYRVNQY